MVHKYIISPGHEKFLETCLGTKIDDFSSSFADIYLNRPALVKHKMAPSRIDTPQAQSSVIPPSKDLKSTVDDGYGSYYPVDPDTLDLQSNFGPMEPGSVGYLQPTAVDTPLEIMHERYERDGYLFVRSAHPNPDASVSYNTNTFGGFRSRSVSLKKPHLPVAVPTLSTWLPAAC